MQLLPEPEAELPVPCMTPDQRAGDMRALGRRGSGFWQREPAVRVEAVALKTASLQRNPGSLASAFMARNEERLRYRGGSRTDHGQEPGHLGGGRTQGLRTRFGGRQAG